MLNVKLKFFKQNRCLGLNFLIWIVLKKIQYSQIYLIKNIYI